MTGKQVFLHTAVPVFQIFPLELTLFRSGLPAAARAHTHMYTFLCVCVEGVALWRAARHVLTGLLTALLQEEEEGEKKSEPPCAVKT